jgi:hypothetical protein
MYELIGLVIRILLQRLVRALDHKVPLSQMYELIGLVIRILLQRLVRALDDELPLSQMYELIGLVIRRLLQRLVRALDHKLPLSQMYELIGLVIRILLQRHVVDEFSMDVYGDRVTRGRYTEATYTYVRIWGASSGSGNGTAVVSIYDKSTYHHVQTMRPRHLRSTDKTKLFWVYKNQIKSMCGIYNPRFRESNNKPRMPVAESIAVSSAPSR